MKLQEYPRLLQSHINCADPPVSTILPFLIALRNAGVVDGTPGCGASPAERVEANRLEVLFGAWVDRNPWAQEFIDPPYTIVIPVAAAAAPLTLAETGVCVLTSFVTWNKALT